MHSPASTRVSSAFVYWYLAQLSFSRPPTTFLWKFLILQTIACPSPSPPKTKQNKKKSLLLSLYYRNHPYSGKKRQSIRAGRESCVCSSVRITFPCLLGTSHFHEGDAVPTAWRTPIFRWPHVASSPPGAMPCPRAKKPAAWDSLWRGWGTCSLAWKSDSFCQEMSFKRVRCTRTQNIFDKPSSQRKVAVVLHSTQL